MFMIFYKARVAKQLSPDPQNDLAPDSTDQLVEELRQGLERIIAAVSNYSLAFEALDGMRGEFFSSLFTRFLPVGGILVLMLCRRNPRCISNGVS